MQTLHQARWHPQSRKKISKTLPSRCTATPLTKGLLFYSFSHPAGLLAYMCLSKVTNLPTRGKSLPSSVTFSEWPSLTTRRPPTPVGTCHCLSHHCLSVFQASEASRNDCTCLLPAKPHGGRDPDGFPAPGTMSHRHRIIFPCTRAAPPWPPALALSML